MNGNDILYELHGYCKHVTVCNMFTITNHSMSCSELDHTQHSIEMGCTLEFASCCQWTTLKIAWNSASTLVLVL